MKKFLIAISLSIATTPCFAGLSLTADEAPTDPPWESPATISYVSNGDGTSNVIIDAVFKYTLGSPAKATAGGAMQTRSKFGTFVHRDTISTSPRNDRGISFSYGGTYMPDLSNSSGLASIDWSAKVSLGKTLQEITDTTGGTTNIDRTKDREILSILGYYKFPSPEVDPATNPRPFNTFITSKVSLYSDHSSGGDGTGTGRLSGPMAALDLNVAPLGIDPEANKFGKLGMVPTIRLAAQVQHDASNSGGRQKNTYKLYTASLSINFATFAQGAGAIVPSLNLVRTVGADLLTGRPYQTKTELSFGLTF